jgi:hypothetical protein
MIQDQEIQSPEDEAAGLLRLEGVIDMSALQVAQLRDVMRMAVSGRPGAAAEAARRVAVIRAQLNDVQRPTLHRQVRADDQAEIYQDDQGDEPGAILAVGRDGLLTLAKSGGLTATQLTAARTYRFLYEQAGRGAGLGSQLDDKPRAKRSTSHSIVAAGLYRAYVGVHLTRIERAVMLVDRTGRQLSVLRAVAGEGRTINSLGKGGKGREQRTKALALALDHVALQLHAVKSALVVK